MNSSQSPIWQGVEARHALGLTLGQVYTLTDRKRTVRCVRARVWNSCLTRRIVHTRDLARKAPTV